MYKLLLAITVAISVPTGADAATWYVSTAGNDTYTCTQSQSLSTPKRTINAALTCVGFAAGAGAGDTVQVADGTYAETVTNFPTGTSGNRFTLIAANSRRAILGPGGGGKNIIEFNGDWIRVSGFVVDGTGVNAIAVVFDSGADNNILEDVEVRDVRPCATPPCGAPINAFNGVYGADTTGNVIRDCSIHDIGNVPDDPNNMRNHGIYWQGDNAVIENCEIHTLTGFGIHFYSSGLPFGPDNNIISGNRIYDFALNNPSAAILLDSGSGNVASNNLVYNTASNPNAVAISVQGSNNQALNNTVYNNGYMGLEVVGSGSVARNNIAFKNGTNIVTSGSAVISSNLTFDPGFVSASSFDFRLQASSPAIDAGVTVDLVQRDISGIQRPQGGAYDVGAYEYVGGSAQPSVPTNVRIVVP